ncbi:probable LRR receptor-like serine/threonine-protein kinase At1g06840 isoform X2 [Quercus lobata]|uniref:probable LRR receptor-like serine/threonine-protein kinase At1g06840 isoform X2 n=1 Tax=Quercus lobata TaxID=97700 RepID=UPI001247DB7E|nr:probable LRR receptor-like serine/threonine-protein kinase At1g06840 isoform X2 [Quercus lobata]
MDYLWLHACVVLHYLLELQIRLPTPKKALWAIRSSLIDPCGNLSDWDQGDPCTSNWTGVFCYNTTLDDGHLHVQRLLLLRMNLSGNLSPQLGRLSKLKILGFMWNNITGSIPKEIGNITSLELLLLNGNQLTGPLPEELGYLPNMDRIQIDQNQISGPLPKSFANLNKTKHFHMNNNSISGQIPPELSRLPSLVHLLLDNNNLSGYLPEEFFKLPKLQILQLDNNNFNGTRIPANYSKMPKLLKLSLRNCSLRGPIPDFSQIRSLLYLDLSSNQLNGTIPPDRFSKNITTILLSHNHLTGAIPSNFSVSFLPDLQRLSIANNFLNGSVPSFIWQNRTLNGTGKLTVELQYNKLSNITFTSNSNIPPNVTVGLKGNPLCWNSNLSRFCESETENKNYSQNSTNTTSVCPAQACPPPYEYSPTSPIACFCALPLFVGYRLKSPGFSDFRPYRCEFEVFLTSRLELSLYQLFIDSFTWEEGPRLGMHLKFFPVYNAESNTHVFNRSEIQRIFDIFTSWKIHNPNMFGPYEIISFSLLGFHKDDGANSPSSGLSKGTLAGLVLGTIAVAVTLSAVVTLLIMRRRVEKYHSLSRRRRCEYLMFVKLRFSASTTSIKIDDVKDFTYREMAVATNSFDKSTQVGEGGYGKVYKGVLVDGTVVAIKRAREGSLQGEKEFLTEIEFMSRLHHRNLVSLIGYCDEEGEQMLVYEFMSNGTLRDHLSAKCNEPLSFAMRLRIALGSAKGILYLHTEANPPIFHRDIKASNILLDSKYMAKVADFGLSRLAPLPDIEGIVPAHVSTVVKGTPGYLDPEYMLTRKLTDKSDVYSLGVVFLELLTGMQPISRGKNIVREVNVACKSGMIFSIIDEKMGSYPPKCVVKFLNLALKCCEDETDARPSMVEVVRELESIWHMMPDSDIVLANPLDTNAEKVVSTPSSSSTVKDPYPYVSSEISNTKLVSGAVPSITPR